jgi:hypothetical protein
MECEPVLASHDAATRHWDAPETDDRLSYLSAYGAGWAQGDPDMIRAAVADDYLWDDPEEGRVSKEELGIVLSRMKEKIDGLRDAGVSASYLTLSDPVVDSSRQITTIWWCFAVPGTGIRGLSQIRVGDHGVISEHRSYRTHPHVRIAGLRSRAKRIESRT